MLESNNKNDGKCYLNIFENLPNGQIRFWLQIGLGIDSKDIYIFDPCLKKEVHISLHHGGNIHLRNGRQSKKYSLFKSEWLDNPSESLLKQMIYFRPASDSYPIVSKLPSTLKTINHCYTFYDERTKIPTVFPNMVFKILLGAPTATKYNSQHRTTMEEPNIFIHGQWTIGVIPMILFPRQEHDNGTFMYVFNTSEDIPEGELFNSSKFEIGPKSLTSEFIISKQTFSKGEVACVYYRL